MIEYKDSERTWTTLNVDTAQEGRLEHILGGGHLNILYSVFALILNRAKYVYEE
jgi:hypothetical protein